MGVDQSTPKCHIKVTIAFLLIQDTNYCYIADIVKQNHPSVSIIHLLTLFQSAFVHTTNTAKT